YCQAASRYPTTKPASLKASWKKPSLAAPITENTRNPRMIQSAMLMVQDQAQPSERTRAKSPTRVPLTDDTPRGTFRWCAAQLLGGGRARAVVCSSEFLRGSPVHTAC